MTATAIAAENSTIGLNKLVNLVALIAFLIYAINLSNPVKRLSQVYGNIQKALAAADRVFEILDTKTDVVEKPDAITLPAITGNVEFNDVSFSYDGEKAALEHFTLSVKAGESVALVGPSGAGKTTLASYTSSSVASKRPYKIFSLIVALNNTVSCGTRPICSRKDLKVTSFIS